MSAPNGLILTGDFNGDGYMDYVIYGQIEPLTGLKKTWKLYTYESNTGYVSGVSGLHKTLYSGSIQDCFFYAADVNGDGCDELIIAERLANESSFRFTFLSIKEGVVQVDTITVPDFYQLFFGDFNGDGITDIFFVSKKAGTAISSFSYYSIHGYFDCTYQFDDINNNLCRVRVLDYNGDGKTDIELILQNGNLFIYSIEAGFFSQVFSSTTNYFMDRYFGDFNGDGISDLLTYDFHKTNGLTWKLFFGKGDGTYSDSTIINSNYLDMMYDWDIFSTNGWVMPKHKILIADINGDGRDDIIQATSFFLTSSLLPLTR